MVALIVRVLPVLVEIANSVGVSVVLTLVTVEQIIGSAHFRERSELIRNSGGQGRFNGGFNSLFNETFVGKLVINILEQILIFLAAFSRIDFIPNLRHSFGFFLVEFVLLNAFLGLGQSLNGHILIFYVNIRIIFGRHFYRLRRRSVHKVVVIIRPLR